VNTSGPLSGAIRRQMMKSKKPMMKGKGPMSGASLKEPMMAGATKAMPMKGKMKMKAKHK
jgi:hypothetical protein